MDFSPLAPHPVLLCVENVESELKAVRGVQPTFMTTAQKELALLGIASAEAQLAELKLRVLAAAGDLAETEGARDLGSWLSGHTNADLRAARAETALADALDRRWRHVAAGMADGTVSPAQAKVVVDALDALPEGLDRDLVAKAEGQLVAWCTRFAPHELRALGKRILAVVDPGTAEEADAKRLHEEEQSARAKMRLTFKPQGDGTTRLSGLLPDSAATRLKTYLDAYTSPRNPKNTPTGAGEAERIPSARKLAHALCTLLEHLDPRKLPEHGGDATTLIVTMSLEDLRKELGTAGILDGTDPALGPNLSAAEARRLACTAQIIPAVLGTNSEVLDLGRADRLFRPPQRRAIRLRDRRCRAQGCDQPAVWCETHHLQPWVQGGATDLANGITLCAWHHHRVHDPRYEHQLLPDGDLVIRRKT
ncbi:HNH endonuclease signature motif containing protein [Nocardioides panacisoli]|uniref:HNH endonuclease signature motif containing protein n=1 Tax=Nocardioides panacisoli TaxID=627624 RepID=A0ABP7IE78_9ACTN